MVLVFGTDEAGRGPVIGPLVTAGLVIDEKDMHKLEDIGVKDSKLLTPRQREHLYDKILNIVKDNMVIIISPKEIDDALESNSLNLNWLEAIKTADMVNKLKPDRAILDCPSTNLKAYSAYVRNHLKDKTIKIISEHKADTKYPIVAAASIIAKVTRDREIQNIKKEIGEEIGSGYPSDPITQKFMKENHSKYPDIFRKTWVSYKRLQQQQLQRSLADF
ncbi:MAG: ribonuclease HII [Nanoarchaeota archaeon]|nr:ribonuclease HII [Nanoarchaeota archaeon]MCG2717895.1 ribonuclease HII [Nanoarchaeota archaeon]